MSKLRTRLIHIVSLVSASSIAASCTVDGVRPNVSDVSGEQQAASNAATQHDVRAVGRSY